MSSLTKEQFDNVLLDVRKAFRLLYLYQKRVLDIVQYVGDNLDFRFGGGWNWFTQNTPSGSKVKLDASAWDWLNMYFYEFNFVEKSIDNNIIKFSVIIESDTGYMVPIENIKTYLPVQQSSTKLIFLLGKNVWHPDFKDIFDDEDSEIYKSVQNELVYENDKGKLIIKSFPLSRFINLEESAKALNEFMLLLKSNGIGEINILL